MSPNAAFITSMISRSVAQDVASDPVLMMKDEAQAHSFYSVVLLIDITNFTPMTEASEILGPDGVEQLTVALNQCFSIMIDTITASGGEIDSLPGDAVIAFWPTGDTASRRKCVETALHCAITLRDRLAGFQLTDGSLIGTHSALSAGPVRRLYVGGHDAHRLTLLDGEPLRRLAGLMNSAGTNQLIVDADIATLFGGDLSGEPVPGGLCLSQSVTPPTLPFARLDENDLRGPWSVPLQGFLQKGLRQRILAGQDSWLAELRQLTVAFVSLPEFSAEMALNDMHNIVLAMQRAVHRHGGAVQSLSVDDRGAIFFAAFGLPMLAHENDIPRAVAAMQTLAASLRALDCRCRIGIGTGMTYCGLLGTDVWRNYSVRGTVANRAARLMALALEDILVDAATAEGATHQFTFSAPKEVSLKGVSTPVAVATLLDTPVRPAATPSAKIVGRTGHLAELAEALTQLSGADHARAIAIEGLPGVGKSMLLDALAEEADQQAITVLRGSVDTLDVGATYAGWRTPLQSLLGLETGGDVGAAQEKISVLLPNESHWQDRLPLLAPILRLALNDNALTRQMDAATRTDNTDALLHMLIQQVAEQEPLVILIDDGQWMDSASWRLLLKLCESALPLLLVVGLRSDHEQIAESYSKFCDTTEAKKIILGDLNREETRQLIANMLNVRDVPTAITEFVFSNGAGNPYYSQQLTQALHEQGHLLIEDGQCQLSEDVENLNTIDFPDSIERVIVSRVDQLTPDLQLMLKVASVIGREFLFDALVGVHPLRPNLDECYRNSVELVQRSFTEQLLSSTQLAFLFRHIIAHQTVYALITYADRRKLHQSVGNWIEDNIADARQTHKVVLAFHWSMADRPDLAIYYLEEAGREALDGSSFKEAADFYNRGLEALDKLPAASDRLRQARMHFGLGEIYTRLGRGEASQEQFCAGLATLNVRWPQTKAQLGIAMTKALLRQAWHRWRSLRPDPERDVKQRESAIALGLEKFGYLFFFEQRFAEMGLTAMWGLNYAELANAAPIIRRSFAQISISFSIARMKKWANFYADSVDTLPEAGSSDLDIAYQYLYLAMHNIGQGRWQPAHHYLSEGLDRAGKLGNLRLEIDLLAFRRSAFFIQGDYTQGAKANRAYRDAVVASTETQQQYFMRIAHGEFAIRFRQLHEAQRLLNEAHARLLPGFQLDKLHVDSLLAVIQHRLGNKTRALKLADIALEGIKTAQPIGYYAVEAYAGVCEIYLDFLAEPDSGRHIDQKGLKKRARKALSGFNAFSLCFAIARARYLILKARYIGLFGRNRPAIDTANTALKLAKELGLAYDIARAHAQLGALVDLAPEQRMQHLQAAEKAFKALGLQYEAMEVAQALAFLTAGAQ